MDQNTLTVPPHPEWDVVLARYHPTLHHPVDAALYAWLRVRLQDDEADRHLLSDRALSRYWCFHDLEQAWTAIGMVPPGMGF